MFMIAIEATIVSTAMPRIIAELGGMHLYSWVFSSFLLAQTALTVVFGNLADIYGRKPVMLWGIFLFLVGSLLAGCAWSMYSMIAFRVIQGIGAGAMQPVAMTIVADLYPARERGKIQGYLASVWAVSAVVGPLVGAFIIRHASWAWVFWISIPVGIGAAAGFTTFLHDSSEHHGRTIDIAGAISFSIACTALLFALSELGSASNGSLLVAAILFLVATTAFVLQERRAVDPMISFAQWSHRPIAATNGAAVLASMALMGLTTFLPIYVQIVLNRSAIVAGLALTMMLLGWPIGATLAARLFHRIALRSLLLAGTLLLPAGASIFVFLTPDSSPVTAGCGSIVMGFGMGLLSVCSLVLVQEVVDRSQRGSVTASNLFSRNLGSTLGATALGAVLNHGLLQSMGSRSIGSDQLRRLLDEPQGAAIAGTSSLRLALQHSLHLTFWAMFVFALLGFFVALMIPTVNIAAADAQRVDQ